jgi:hypothetical protein
MKRKIAFILIIIAPVVLYFSGCTDLLSNSSSSNVGPLNNLSIKINNPLSNDTIGYTGTTITYTLTKDFGINFIELYVNGVINKWNPPNSDGSQPIIPINLDSTYINKRISYYLIYYDKDGFSARSDTIKNILISATKILPYIPYNLTVTRISDNVINISWKDSTSGSLPGYEIWRKRGFYSNFAIESSSPPSTFNVNDNDAADTTVYYYKIRGLNLVGTSNFSAVINTYGDGATHSIAPPTDLTATALSGNEVQLTWIDDVKNENYFKIERRYSWSVYTGVGYAVKGASQFTDSANGLTPYMGYYYRVKAYSSSDSSWSNEVFVQTPSQ